MRSHGEDSVPVHLIIKMNKIISMNRAHTLRKGLLGVPHTLTHLVAIVRSVRGHTHVSI